MTPALSAPEAATLAVFCALMLLAGAASVMLATSGGRAFLAQIRGSQPQTGQPVVRIVTGPLAGDNVNVTERVVLGRDPARAQLVFPPEDTSVSRQHCAIRYDAAARAFEVEDLKSSNGTFLLESDGRSRRLEPGVKERVSAGHVLLVGGTDNQLVLELR